MKFSLIPLTAIMVTVLAFGPSGSLAQSSGSGLDPLCDVGLWKQMNDRARLHTNMFSTQVQNLIYKPDSVFEYTCFDKMLNKAVANIDYYYLPWYTDKIIRQGVLNWLYSNFDHTFMGGRYVEPSGNTATTDPEDYTCDAMAKVWATARCLNFADQTPYEDFYDIESFINLSTDIRRFPTATCALPDKGSLGSIPYKGTAVATSYPPGKKKDGSIDCGVPIPTGYVINIPAEEGENRPAEYQEKICSNPACHYTVEQGGGKCVP